MDVLQQGWGAVMAWVPPPLRLVVALVLALLVVLRGIPAALRACAACLQRSGRLLALLTFPEYVLTSLARRLQRPPVPGTFAYGRLLGAVHGGLVAAGGLLLRAGRYRPRLRRWVFLSPAALVVAVWYSASTMPPGEIGDAVRVARTGLATTDAWLMPAGAVLPPGAGCPVGPRPSPSVTKRPVRPTPAPRPAKKG